ncbi:MAG: SDR family oxidoreductase [Desulfobulbaceae bacterium]|nr:SDR family oxidoreductase [Desulfobulbaceae bacterium]
MNLRTDKVVLVTGGAGFLGFHLCSRLIKEGCRVICLDNLSTCAPDNIAQLSGNSQFQLLEHDITKPISIEIDEIYNLACPASPIHYQRDPIKTTRTCVLGALNMLDLAVNCGARILQASTSEVYGDPVLHPQQETYWGNVNPHGLRSCYDEGKRCAESLFFDYWRQHAVVIKVARIFNTYGPNMHQDDGRVISNFIIQALSNKPLTIYGDGSQTRSFCYVKDMIEAFLRLMATKNDCTGPINLGNPKEFTIRQIAEKIIDLTNSSAKIVQLPLPSDDPLQRCPDISRAQEQLDWEPTTSLDVGLKETIEYFERQLKKTN